MKCFPFCLLFLLFLLIFDYGGAYPAKRKRGRNTTASTTTTTTTTTAATTASTTATTTTASASTTASTTSSTAGSAQGESSSESTTVSTTTIKVKTEQPSESSTVASTNETAFANPYIAFHVADLFDKIDELLFLNETMTNLKSKMPPKPTIPQDYHLLDDMIISFFNTTVGSYEAKKTCFRANGYLFNPRTMEENEFIKNNFQGPYWTDLTRMDPTNVGHQYYSKFQGKSRFDPELFYREDGQLKSFSTRLTIICNALPTIPLILRTKAKTAAVTSLSFVERSRITKQN